jgi:hypothetical protein
MSSPASGGIDREPLRWHPSGRVPERTQSMPTERYPTRRGSPTEPPKHITKFGLGMSYAGLFNTSNSELATPPTSYVCVAFPNNLKLAFAPRLKSHRFAAGIVLVSPAPFKLVVLEENVALGVNQNPKVFG